MPLRTLALVLAALFLFAACGQDTMSGFKLYENDEEGFTIQYPEDWGTMNMGALVTFAAPLTPGAEGRPNLTVTTEFVGDQITPEEYLEQAKPMLVQVLPGCEFLDQEPVTVNGVDGVRFHYTIELQDKHMTLVVYALLRDGKAYVFTGGSLTKDFQDYEPLFDTMCNTITFS